MNITATYLHKKNKGRMVNVNTLLMKGGDEIEESCKNNEITGFQSIKSSDECGIRSIAEDSGGYPRIFRRTT